MFLIAQNVAGFTLIHWLILAIVIIVVIGIFLAFVKYSGVTIPPLFVTIFWIVIGAIFAIAAIKIVLSML